MRLFKKDSTNSILEWYIDTDENSVVSYVGKIDGKKVHQVYMSKDPKLEVERKVYEKLKQGWINIDNLILSLTSRKILLSSLDNPADINSAIKILSKVLPDIKSDIRNRPKPQKAVLFKYDSFKYPGLLQPKLNGLRASIAWEIYEEGEGIFKETKEGVVISSKEGNVYVLPHIANSFTKDDFLYISKDGEVYNIIYDGEIYYHGMKLNEIRASIPMINKFGTVSKPSNNSELMQFWCYDLILPDVIQVNRLNIKHELLDKYPKVYDTVTVEDTKSPIIDVLELVIDNDKDARKRADMLIDANFEGGIMRDISSKYINGRTKFMVKLKKWFYTKCVILDIIEKKVVKINDNNRTYISILLKNDINNETFESSIEGDEDVRQDLLSNKDYYIGKTVEIKYRERSGVKNVPFQSSIYKII